MDLRVGRDWPNGRVSALLAIGFAIRHIASMIFAFADFELDAQRLELRRAGIVVHADPLVLRLLAALVSNAGRLVSKDELVQEVWDGRAVAENVITVSMARLRKTLEHKRGENEIVATVYGRGYRFVSEVTERRGPLPSSVRKSGYAAPVFVGRERAIEDLQRAYDEAQRGRGRLCVLLGEPGIGKTHAVETFVRGLADEAVASWGFCREAGDTPPLFPWLRMLREVVASVGEEQLVSPAERSVLQQLLHEPSSPPSPSSLTTDVWLQGQQRHRAFEVISRLLARAADQRPQLFVLEDLHRADAATLELLVQLLDEIGLRRMLVIATVRHTESAARAAVEARVAQVLGHPNCERIQLQRLREPEVRSYVTALFGEREEELARAVFEKSEGNPFFMAELCRQVRACEPSERDMLAVPQAALELIRQHVATLDVEARGVLSAAAVIGRSFELWQLHAITGRDLGLLMSSLDAALAAEVLIAAPDSATAFAFGHELLRAVLYDALTPAERRSWHVRVAEALDVRVRQDESIAPSELAYHLHAGLPQSDLKKTVHYCRLAAARAAGSFANDDVVRYARHALQALDLMERPSLKLRMHLTYLIAMYARGDSADEYESATRELARIARKCGDGSMLVRAAIMFNLHPGFKQLSGAGDALSRALELLPSDDRAMRSVALAGLAMSSPTCFSDDATTRLLSEAVPLARESTSRGSRYVALIAALHLHGGPDHVREASAVLEELDLLAQQNPTRMPVLPVDLALYRAVTALQRGALGDAARSLEGASAHCRRLHHSELLWHTERMRALLALHEGSSPAALSELQRLHDRAAQRALFGVELFCAFDEAVWLGELGARGQLDDAARRALAYDASDPPSLWSLKIRGLAAAGLSDEARTALRALAPHELARLPCDRDLLGTLGHLARAALLIGALEHADAAVARLASQPDAFAAHIGFTCEGSVRHLVGAVALARGDFARAVSELETGLALDGRAGLALSAGYARIELGRALLGLDKHSERTRARLLFMEARSQGERLGFQRLARAAALLQEESR
jgi:DNA-binding winged helix-turn-helix (wHTH) protein